MLPDGKTEVDLAVENYVPYLFDSGDVTRNRGPRNVAYVSAPREDIFSNKCEEFNLADSDITLTAIEEEFCPGIVDCLPDSSRGCEDMSLCADAERKCSSLDGGVFSAHSGFSNRGQPWAFAK